MQPHKLTGPEAGSLKYDVLTALSVAGLNGSPTLQTSMTRLIALVTARYNWRLDEVSVGQRDMARMWSVNERTVKREMKRLTETGFLICKRAGVRGRVGAYTLNLQRIAEMTETCWSLVGPDFEARMSNRYASGSVKVVRLSDYSKEPDPPTIPDEPSQAGTWSAVRAKLKSEQPELFNAWYRKLEFVGHEKATLSLRAPSAFVQTYIETHHLPPLITCAENELGPIDRLTFI